MTFRPIVFIGGPFRGDNNWHIELNIRAAEEAALQLAEKGMIPLCPHTMYRFFQGTLPDDFWLEATTRLLDKCHALYLLPTWESSSGAKGEKAEAERIGIPIFYDVQTLNNWYVDERWRKYMPMSSGSWIWMFMAEACKTYGGFDRDRQVDLDVYLDTLDPKSVKEQNVRPMYDFILTYLPSADNEILAARLRDAWPQVFGDP